jgi:hypothetical protein
MGGLTHARTHSAAPPCWLRQTAAFALSPHNHQDPTHSCGIFSRTPAAVNYRATGVFVADEANSGELVPSPAFATAPEADVQAPFPSCPSFPLCQAGPARNGVAVRPRGKPYVAHA